MKRKVFISCVLVGTMLLSASCSCAYAEISKDIVAAAWKKIAKADLVELETILFLKVRMKMKHVIDEGEVSWI